MTEDINKNVISIFRRHKSNKLTQDDSKLIKCDDDVYCVTIKHDVNGHPFHKADLIERANEIEYLVKVLIETPTNPYINNYIVKGEDLISFIDKFIKHKKKGTVIEIDKYIPDDLA